MRAVICGAGIAGLTLAWWLRRQGAGVLLLEHASGPRGDGYMIDFFGSGYDVAERMGVLGDLREVAADIAELAYADERGRRVGGLRYPVFEAMLRGRVLSLMRGDLERVLRCAVAPAPAAAEPVPGMGGDLEIRYGTSVAGFQDTPGGVAVRLTDGRTVDADLLVGADGIHSVVRRLAFGPEERFLRPLGYHTASYSFRDDGLLARIGPRFVIVGVPGRQAGLYPTPDGRVAVSLVHAVGADAAAAAGTAGRAAGTAGTAHVPGAAGPSLPDDPRAEILRTYRGLGELVDEALPHCPDKPYYDHVAQVVVPGWSRGRVVLVGDACQAVSLMAGQGASLAMGGAYVLATELRAAELGPALARYERRMIPFVRDKQESGRRTARWMVPGSRWRIGVRNRMLGLGELPGGPAVLSGALRRLGASVVA